MSSPFQQQALQRKLIYIALIVVLFTASGVFRAYVVEAKAKDLALLEQNLGDVELGGSALRLSLTGSRGFVVCVLWSAAIDAQKKNRWNELELYVNALTKLQPHFISPWLFQSWNLAYNVSVEADQVKDKYFYVSRGVLLLCEGERQNRHHPDLRFSIGSYQQQKIMQSDESNVFRCLYQMSCMPPPERNPERFWRTDADGRPALDVAAFEQFCKDHPQFVRRLHDKLRCGKPEDVVRFLDDNRSIPTIYVDDPDEAGLAWQQKQAPLKKVPERFPALPPPAHLRAADLPLGGELYDKNELSYDSELNDGVDGYAAARAWYAYAQEALPAPDPELPGESAKISDRTRQRKPQWTTSIFRTRPPRAQSYIGERLQQEGWFGPEGWLITGWFPYDRFGDKTPAVVGAGTSWSEDAWRKAHDMWEQFGKANHMLIDAQEEAEKRALALEFLTSRNLPVGPPPGPEPSRDDPNHKGWKATQFIFLYTYSRNLTNFRFHYYRSLVEMDPDMIEAHHTLFDAVQSARQGKRSTAIELFEKKTGLEQMRKILEKYPQFRDDSFNQEDLYETELRYIKLMQDYYGPISFRPCAVACSLLGAGVPQGAAPAWPGLSLYFTRPLAAAEPPAPGPYLMVMLQNDPFAAAACSSYFLTLPTPALIDPSLLSAMPVPEFVPAERMRLEAPGNLMKDEKEREKYQQVLAISNLLITGTAPQSAAPLWTWQMHLATSQDRSKLSNVLPAPAFIPAPGKDGLPFITDEVIRQVKVRHGLLKPIPMAPPGGEPPPGMPPGGPQPRQ